MIRVSDLSCGIQLVTEDMPGAHSASIGFWVGTGSRDETDAQAGISHFLEHLLFKGTPTRSAREIAEDMDGVGGDMNAFTTKEYTAFYVRTLANDSDLGLGILSEIMTEPALRENEVDAERQVILEEVLMHLDEPSDVVQELFAEAIFSDHPLGREVLGSPEVITSVPVGEIRSFFSHHYRPGNIVLAAAGRVDHELFAKSLESRFAGAALGSPPVRLPPSLTTKPLSTQQRDTEQAHLVLGVRAPERRSPDRFALSLLNHSLGGGISSRLFQKIREERGLAYSVVSDRVAYADAGALVVAVGTAPERAHEVLELVRIELNALAKSGVTERELDLAKRHVKADTVLSLEDSGARMSRIGASLLLHDEVLEVEDLISKIESVTLEEVANLAERLFSAPRTLAVVGPFDAEQFVGEID